MIDEKTLWEISGLFDDFVEKWPDKKMIKFVAGLYKKIKDAGYQP